MNDIAKYAARIRGKVIQLSHQARTPHLGSSLSCVDIMVALYRNHLRIDANNAQDPERDRFFLSKGHAVTTLYSILAEEGFFPESELDQTYAIPGSRLPEHPNRNCVPGIEASTGSLGHGLGLATGVALGNRIKNLDSNTYALLSDGECNEGSTWEAAMTAPALKLSRLCAIVDFNKWQATGRSTEVLSLDPLEEKFHAFGWETYRIDGHDFGAIEKALGNFPSTSDKPTAIIADTIKGKGISIMEDDNNWHYRIPTEDEVTAARKELGLS